MKGRRRAIHLAFLVMASVGTFASFRDAHAGPSLVTAAQIQRARTYLTNLKPALETAGTTSEVAGAVIGLVADLSNVDNVQRMTDGLALSGKLLDLAILVSDLNRVLDEDSVSGLTPAEHLQCRIEGAEALLGYAASFSPTSLILEQSPVNTLGLLNGMDALNPVRAVYDLQFGVLREVAPEILDILSYYENVLWPELFHAIDNRKFNRDPLGSLTFKWNQECSSFYAGTLGAPNPTHLIEESDISLYGFKIRFVKPYVASAEQLREGKVLRVWIPSGFYVPQVNTVGPFGLLGKPKVRVAVKVAFYDVATGNNISFLPEEVRVDKSVGEKRLYYLTDKAYVEIPSLGGSFLGLRITYSAVCEKDDATLWEHKEDLPLAQNLDTVPPEAQLHVPDSYPRSGVVSVRWNARDGGGIVESGVWAYDLWWKEDLGPWHGWYTRTTQTVAEFQVPEPGHQYYFRLVAVDRFGNRSTEVVCGSGPEGNPVQNPEQIPQPPAPERRVFGGYVLPSALETLGEVAYRTYWRHPLGKMPDKAVLWRRIGSSPTAFEGFNIEPAVGNGADGAAFERRLRVLAGDGWENQFYFELTCEGKTYRDPEQGYYSGPAVTRRDDFAVTGMKLDPTNPLGGQVAKVLVSFANVGTVARAGAQVSLFVDGQQLGQSYGTSYYLFPGSSDEAAFTWAIPLVDEEKTYTLEARVSFPGDGNATNNTLQQQIAIGPPPGSISGRVFDEFSNEVSRATVMVVGGPSRGSFDTDEQGYFLLDGLRPGTYSVQAFKDTVKQTIHNVTVHAGQDTGESNLILASQDMQEIYHPSLSNDLDTVKHIAWSADGSKLVFQLLREGFNEIWVINRNGTGLAKVAGEGLPIYEGQRPATSRVSDRFTFGGTYRDAQNNIRFALYIFRFSNLSAYERRLDTPLGASENVSGWYPNEDAFLYNKFVNSSVKDIAKYAVGTGQSSVVIPNAMADRKMHISPDGLQVVVYRSLYSAVTGELLTSNYIPSGWDFSWLPDGTGIVYDDNSDIRVKFFNEEESYAFLAAPDDDIYPSLSPDGTTLAFASTRGFSTNGGYYGLWLTPFETRSLSLANLQLLPETRFSPNGDDTDDTLQITFALTQSSHVSVRLLDSQGLCVKHLVDQEQTEAGACSFTWDGSDDLGVLVPSQVYYVDVCATNLAGETSVPLRGRIGVVESGYHAFERAGHPSPDMTKLVYASSSGGANQWRIKDLVTGSDSLLADAAYFNSVEWDNTSTRVAFEVATPGPRIAWVDTNNLGSPFVVPMDLKYSQCPSWSSDGQRLAFIGTWLSTNPEQLVDEHEDLFVVNADGSNLHRITDVGPNRAYLVYYPQVWTENDTQILVCYEVPGSGIARHIYKVDLSTGAMTQLTYHPFGESAPLSSPDGRQFLYQSSRASFPQGSDTWIEYLDGSQMMGLLNTMGALQVSNDGFAISDGAGYVRLFNSISKGIVRGRVLEAKGDDTAGLSGVSVLVQSDAECRGFGITNRGGYFAAVNVDPGTYTLRFEKQGYKPQEIAGITISPNKTSASNDVTLARLPEVVLTEPNVSEKRYRDALPVGVTEVTHDVSAVRFEVAGIAKDNWTVLGTNIVAPFSWPLDSLGVADGTEQVFQIRAIAINASQEEDDAPSILRVVVDKKAPVPTLTQPTTGTEFAFQAPITLQATCEDTDVDNIVFQYRLNGEEQWHNAGAASSSPYVLLWTPLDPLVGSQYEVRAVAFDIAGNSGVSGTSTVSVDVTALNAPVVTGVTLTNNPTPTWNWASGGGGGSGTFRFDLDIPAKAWTETAATAYTPDAPLSDGPHTLYVQERDDTGNWSASGAFTTTVDTVPPAASIDAPSATQTRNGPVTYTVTYGGADAVALAISQVILNKTGTADGTISVSGAGLTARSITISDITGDGSLGISLAAGTASDAAGNLAGGAGPSATFTVDTTPPTVEFDPPSVSVTRNGPVTFTVKYSDADTVTLANPDVSLVKTGTAEGAVEVNGTGNTTRTVTVSGITGDGTLAIAVAANTAADTAGNNAAAAGPSAAFTVDNTPPTVDIDPPSVSVTRNGPVTFTVKYSDADTVSLANPDVSLVKTGTAEGAVEVSGTGNTTRTVTVSGITGDGTLAIAVAANTAADTAGNNAVAAGPSATFTVDTTRPTVDIDPPSVAVTRNGPVTFTVKYSNADTVTLAAPDVSLVKTGTANGTVSVAGTGNTTRTVTISDVIGDGTLGISIAAGTASDSVGNTAEAAGLSTAFTVDNTAPTVELSAGPFNVRTMAVTAHFSEPVQGFEATDIEVTNGHVANFLGSGVDYSFSVETDTTSSSSAHVPEGAASDAAGNLSSGSNTITYAAGSIRGKVVEKEDTGKPVVSALVRVQMDSPGVNRFALTDPNGMFRVTDLPVGVCTLVVYSPSFLPKEVHPNVKEGLEHELLLPLEPRSSGPAIRGRVTEASLLGPAVGVEVSAYAGEQLLDTTYTDGQGEYRLDILGKSGSVQLMFSWPGYTSGSIEVSVPAEGEVQLPDVVLTSDFVAQGQLTVGVRDDAGRQPISGARVTLYGLTNRIDSTDEQGNTLFSALPVGEYLIEAAAEGYDIGSLYFDVTGSTQDYVELLLHAGVTPIGPLDPNHDGKWNAMDVQLVINGALGRSTLPAYDCDQDEDGKINATDVQLTINHVLQPPVVP